MVAATAYKESLAPHSGGAGLTSRTGGDGVRGGSLIYELGGKKQALEFRVQNRKSGKVSELAGASPGNPRRIRRERFGVAFRAEERNRQRFVEVSMGPLPEEVRWT